MRISIKVKPGNKEEKIDKIDDNAYEVSIKERAERGKANISLIKLLAEYFDVPSSAIKIKSGLASKSKILEILR